MPKNGQRAKMNLDCRGVRENAKFRIFGHRMANMATRRSRPFIVSPNLLIITVKLADTDSINCYQWYSHQAVIHSMSTRRASHSGSWYVGSGKYMSMNIPI